MKHELSEDEDAGVGNQLEDKYADARFPTDMEQNNVEFKHFLPLKTPSGKLIQVTKKIKKEVTDQEPLVEKSAESDTENPENVDPMPISTAQLFANRLDLVEQYKSQIASNCSLLIGDPQNNVSNIF